MSRRNRTDTWMKLADLCIKTTGFESACLSIAKAGFLPVGEGHHATLYGNPKYPDVLIRAGNSVDGFAAYAEMSTFLLESYVGEHVPVVLDLAITRDHCLIVLAERLEPIPEDGPIADVAKAAACIMAGRTEAADADHLRTLRDEYPRFERFAKELMALTGRVGFDVRPENFMLRGGALIFNDPLGTGVPPHRIPGLRDLRFPVSTEIPSVREPWWNADDAMTP